VFKRALLQAIKDGFDTVVPASSLPLQASIDNVRAISATVKEHNKKRELVHLINIVINAR
jgi:hypothetical protein